MSQNLAHSPNETSRTKDVIIVETVTFESLLLSQNVLEGLTETGFKKPSPIQLKAIPLGRCGFDLIVKSKSGTGKTVVFAVIALENVNTKKEALQALVLAPTREIAVQVQEVLGRIGSHIKDLKVESFIGGLPITEDKPKCKSCHIAIGTPGRIKQLINEGVMATDSIRVFVLDEADKLMESSFQNDINEIYNSLPSKKQIITTSATYTKELEGFLAEYMCSPTHVTAELDTPLLLGLKQFVAVVETFSNVVQQMRAKTDELLRIFSSVSFTQCIVFTNYQTRAESLSNLLNQKGLHSTFISAAQTQSQRLAAVKSLKEFESRIMLSTDLTARGIDAANVDLVINYDIPSEATTYLHRMGRAGRYGSFGVCINLVSGGSEMSVLQGILGHIGGTSLSIPKLPAFTGNISDLLKMEVSSLEHIFGRTDIISESYHGEMKQSKVYDMVKKDRKSKSTKSKSKKRNHNVESMDCKESEGDNTKVLSMLDDDRNEVEEVRRQISNMDTQSILESLASQQFKMDLNTDEGEEKIDSESILQSLSGKDTRKIKSKKSNHNVQSVDCKESVLQKDCDNSKFLSILDDNKNEVEEVRRQISNMDTHAILESLASQQFEMDSHTDGGERVEKIDGDSILQTLSTRDMRMETTKTEDKAAIDSILHKLLNPKITETTTESDCREMNKDKRRSSCTEEQKQKETFAKNMALLSVSQILNGRDTGKSNSEESSIQQYLDILKKQDREEVSQLSKLSLTDILGSLQDVETVPKSNPVAVPPDEKTPFDMENLFKFGYENLVKTNDDGWKTLLDSTADDDLQEQMVEDDFQDQMEEDEYLSMEEECEDKEVDITKWVPVERASKKREVEQTCASQTVERVSTNYDGFTTYFDDCSENLWQHGLSFDSVESFDDWFHYEWEAQLHAVRNFVQQNVYVKEMSSYQNAMAGKK